MDYFGVQDDVLSYLSSECDASAPHFDKPVRDALNYLSEKLEELAPLYEAICDYGSSEERDNTNVINAYRDCLSKLREK